MLNIRRAAAVVLALTVIQTSVLAESVTPNTLSVGLGGYSPVSYFESTGPQFGSPRYQATHEGVTYFLASEGELRRFRANPAKYVPAYGGWCAYGMAVEGKFDADPTNYEIVDGRIHVFLRNQELDTRPLWKEGNESELRTKADAFWTKLNARPSRAYVHSHNVPASGVAIDGYSPVSYFTKGKAERGRPEFAVEHEGITYLLTSQEQVEVFKASPDRFVLAYGGWCAFGMAIQDKFPVDPTRFKIVNGRLMLFLRNEQVDALALWNKGDERENLRKADAHWTKVSK